MSDTERLVRLQAEVERTVNSPGFRYFLGCMADMKRNLQEEVVSQPLGATTDEVAMNYCKSAGAIEGIRMVERMPVEILRAFESGREPNFAGEDRNMQEGDPDGRY